jgi:hypothetical protein
MKEATITRAKSAYASDFYNMLTKSCANCDTDLSPADFVAIDNASIFCLSCFMTSAKISPKDFSKILKSAIGCEICGFSKSAFALQYDHTDHATKYRTKSGKIVEPSDLFRTCSVSVFIAEISKCVIRCANCHAIKTAKERGLE